jgi:hypothetical protein
MIEKREKHLPSTDNTMFYSTSSSGYAIYSAVSLLTIRDYLPSAKLCVLSSYLSSYDKKILEKHNIEYRIIHLKSKFTKTWDYPIECYYIFAGPQLFYQEGYHYSVYIDGDVLCKLDPLQGVPEFGGLAGVASAMHEGKYISVFGNDWHEIRKVWNLNTATEIRKRVNSGVVYFNNTRMLQIGLLEKVSQLFKLSLEKSIPRKGDDSLFSLFQYVYMDETDITFLPPHFNFVLQYNKWNYPVDDLVFFHFSLDKPWKKQPYKHEDSQLDIYNPYVRDWRRKYKKIAPKAWLKGLVD